MFGRTSAPGLPPKWRKCLTTPSATWRRIELILKEQSADAEHSRWSFIFARSHNPHNHHTSCWQPSPELVERAMEKLCLISLLMDHDNIFFGYCFPESLLLIRILGTDLSLMILFPKILSDLSARTISSTSSCFVLLFFLFLACLLNSSPSQLS